MKTVGNVDWKFLTLIPNNSDAFYLICKNHRSNFLHGPRKPSLFDMEINALCHPPDIYSKELQFEGGKKIPQFNCN